MGSGSFRDAWRESWEASNRAYAEAEERGRQRHAARQDRLRGGATSVEVRETFASTAPRIVRRTLIAIPAAVGAVFFAPLGFEGMRDNIGDFGVPFWAGLGAAGGTLVFGSVAVINAASVLQLVLHASRKALLAAADERGITLVTGVEGDLPLGGGPAWFAWPEVASIARYRTHTSKAAELDNTGDHYGPEHLVIQTRDGRMVRTMVDGPRRPWKRLMLVARDVGGVDVVSGIDNAHIHYSDTDPFRLRFGT